MVSTYEFASVIAHDDVMHVVCVLLAARLFGVLYHVLMCQLRCGAYSCVRMYDDFGVMCVGNLLPSDTMVCAVCCS